MPVKPLLLIFPFGYLSHYTRCLRLARYFSQYFNVQFAWHEQYATLVHSEGFSTFYCKAIDAAAVAPLVKRFDFSWINEARMEPVLLDQVLVMEALKPMAVLGDASPTLGMAAEKTGTYYISLMNGYMSKYYARVRKLSQTHPAFSVLKLLPAALLEKLTHEGEKHAFARLAIPFARLRKRYGLRAKHSYLDEWEGDLNLLCDLNTLFPQKKLPANYRLIAPLYYEGAGSSGVALTAQPDPRKRTLFVSMGSTGDWNAVRFLNHPYFNRYNIVTAGDTNHVLQGSHVIAAPFVQAQEVLPLASLVICHGGNGTIYQALFFGLPVLCCTCHFEQEWNVDALERAGVGQSLNGITGIDKIAGLIQEWIEKKETGRYPSLHEQIGRQAQELEGVVHTIARMLTGQPDKLFVNSPLVNQLG